MLQGHSPCYCVDFYVCVGVQNTPHCVCVGVQNTRWSCGMRALYYMVLQTKEQTRDAASCCCQPDVERTVLVRCVAYKFITRGRTRGYFCTFYGRGTAPSEVCCALLKDPWHKLPLYERKQIANSWLVCV